MFENYEDLIDSLRNVIERLDVIINYVAQKKEGQRYAQYKDDLHQYTLTEIKGIREFLRKELEETVERYVDALKNEKLKDVEPLPE